MGFLPLRGTSQAKSFFHVILIKLDLCGNSGPKRLQEGHKSGNQGVLLTDSMPYILSQDRRFLQH